ncbi:hypothetical protein HaloA020_05080 [Halomonas sp. A020]|nr:hypothetical protein HaloA020_05080 [Halomonas sp. A020]
MDVSAVSAALPNASGKEAPTITKPKMITADAINTDLPPWFVIAPPWLMNEIYAYSAFVYLDPSFAVLKTLAHKNMTHHVSVFM